MNLSTRIVKRMVYVEKVLGLYFEDKRCYLEGVWLFCVIAIIRMRRVRWRIRELIGDRLDRDECNPEERHDNVTAPRLNSVKGFCGRNIETLSKYLYQKPKGFQLVRTRKWKQRSMLHVYPDPLSDFRSKWISCFCPQILKVDPSR